MLDFVKIYWVQIMFFCTLIIGFIKFSHAMIEATKCSLRNDILTIYDKCKDKEEITKYQLESIELSYKQYKALKGNSFVDSIHSRVLNYKIVD